MSIEYRVCWSASSNISFEGSTDWTEWGGFEETAEEVETAVMNTPDRKATNISQALEKALEVSGFEFWVETRETATDTQEGR